jgi:hypothetical protein
MHQLKLLSLQAAELNAEGVRETPKETADLSTTLRSGRDDNSVAAKISYFSWKRGTLFSNRVVISTGAKRSGEICGFFFGFLTPILKS